MQAHIDESGNNCIWWKIVFYWPKIENMFSLNNEARVIKQPDNLKQVLKINQTDFLLLASRLTNFTMIVTVTEI